MEELRPLNIALIAEDRETAYKVLEEIAARNDVESISREQIVLKDGCRISAISMGTQVRGHQFDQILLYGVEVSESIKGLTCFSCIPEELRIQKVTV